MGNIKKIIEFLEENKNLNLENEKIEEIKDLVNHNEIGIALENVCSLLYENDVKLDNDTKSIIVFLEKSMNMNIEEIKYL